jgi:CHRD domain-containing protein
MRRRIITILGLASATVVSLAPAGLADTAEQFTVPLSGDQVVPGPGDPDGGGGVFVAMGRQTGSFCFFADTANISTPLTAVHLHRGVGGGVGEVVTVLHGRSDDPDTSGCFNLSRDRIRDISKNRKDYYIDIHTETEPDGALRGQLG